MTFFDRIKQMITDDEALPPIARLVGFRPVEAERGRVVLELTVAEQHHNAVGTLHGGVLCDVTDAAMGLSWATTLAEGESFTTVELKINYLRPFWAGKLRVIGRVVNAGRTLGLTEAEVFDEGGKLIARASSTLMTLRGEQARGR
jgi:uncharacterized protein (TIGR00369 family)